MILLGFNIYQDYGVPWDDPIQRLVGQLNWEYINGKSTWLIESKHANYGPIFELFLFTMEKWLHLEQLRAIYLFRHAMTYASFCVGTFFFYLLCLRMFRNWKMGLLGCILLILTPRIFENAFYNTKDIPFLALNVICLYLLLVLIDQPKLVNFLMMAIASAFLITVRNVGIIIPILVMVIWIIRFSVQEKSNPRKESFKHFVLIILYLVVTYGLVVLMWPALWKEPFTGFYNTVVAMANFQWRGTVLFMGKLMMGKAVPWYYIPVWIAITIPIVYSIFFIIGTGRSVFLVFKGPGPFIKRVLSDRMIILAAVIGPVVGVIVLKSTLYDSWRQLFFIYPGFLIMALAGLEFSYAFLKTRFNRNVSIGILSIILLISFISTMDFMVRYHPHQAVYFNRLAGGDMQSIKSRFDMDYWGLSYYDALKYIAEIDKSDKIYIHVNTLAGEYNTYMLVASEMDRFIVDDEIKDSKYFLSDYRWHPEEYDYPNEIFNVMVGNAKIMVVYQLKPD